MNIEKQVCSFPLAKRLRELNVNQRSIFVYSEGGAILYSPFNNPVNHYIAAFTVAELGEMLPKNFYSRKHRKIGYWQGHLIEKGGDEVTIENTEADARAQILIYLLENGLIKNE